jgi:hypothetical protein
MTVKDDNITFKLSHKQTNTHGIYSSFYYFNRVNKGDKRKNYTLEFQEVEHCCNLRPLHTEAFRAIVLSVKEYLDDILNGNIKYEKRLDLFNHNISYTTRLYTEKQLIEEMDFFKNNCGDIFMMKITTHERDKEDPEDHTTYTLHMEVAPKLILGYEPCKDDKGPFGRTEDLVYDDDEELIEIEEND